MRQRVGRNDPCRCGSGKKYKKCCLGRKPAGDARDALPVSGEFRFKPGSYGAPGSDFLPSAACFKWVGDDRWDYHFVLANVRSPQEDQAAAEALAVADLDRAFAEQERTGSDEAAARMLAAFGYVSVNHFEVVEEDGNEEGFRVAADWAADHEDLDYNPRAQRAILEAVENQIRDQDPPEARETFDRLREEGYEEKAAKKLIGSVLAVQIFNIMKRRQAFDHDWYVAALRRLPTLPEEYAE